MTQTRSYIQNNTHDEKNNGHAYEKKTFVQRKHNTYMHIKRNTAAYIKSASTTKIKGN